MVSEHASPLAVLGGADAGGQNVHVAALAAELTRQGHRVEVHTRRDDPSLPSRLLADGGVLVDHVDAGPPSPIPKDELRPYMDDFAAVLAQRWRKDRPDVVHAHFWMSALASVRAAQALEIPVVVTFHALGTVKRRHQGEADTSPADRLDVERWLLDEVDHVIATCWDEVAELDRFGPPAKGATVIPCGVDLSLFRPDGPAVPRRTAHRVVVVGRLVERKGVADVIEALRSLSDTELLIAGGPSRDELRGDPDVRRLMAAADRCGVSQRARFLGRVCRAELPALLRSADAVVSVPYYEPFGMVPLEAMACGIPPVVSAVGGLRESVLDGETGLHVPPGDPRRLADTLGRLFADPAVARGLGDAGARRAGAVYGWPRVAAQTVAVYQQVAAEPNRARTLTGTRGR
jgi:glycosyltransferase involved in cell wall biosynthesis